MIFVLVSPNSSKAIGPVAPSKDTPPTAVTVASRAYLASGASASETLSALMIAFAAS
jgi:hypothetical protein